MQQNMNSGKAIEKTGLSTQKHRLTVEEYHLMGGADIFEEARVELIGGEIFDMSPIKSPHSGTVNWLNRLLNKLLGDQYIVSVQNPVTLDKFSEPEPDIAILKMREDYYADSHPRPEDVILLMEVAASSLETDKRVKLPNYAKAGISEVWIIDINQVCIEIHMQPWEDTYRTKNIHLPGEAIESTILGTLAVRDIFPKRNPKP